MGAFRSVITFLGGQPATPRSFQISGWLFLRVLGASYLIAFVSFWLQVGGLIGRDGIIPAGPYLEAVHRQLGADRYWLVPTFSWLAPGDGGLHLQCALGTVLALFLLAGVAPQVAALGLWALYVSLSSVGAEFLSFQWDTLLLETGFIGVFVAPCALVRWRLGEKAPPPVMVWVFRFLLFKLMLSSGLVKLLSGDVTWRNLTALTFHYETQPLPTWIGWYAHQLPGWFQKASAAIMFGIELVLPFLVFGPRRLPLIAAGAFTGLMVLISLTGNYCFFNLLTASLCLWLVEDEAWRTFAPDNLAARWFNQPPAAPVKPWRVTFRRSVAAVLLGLSGIAMLTRLVPSALLPAPALELLRLVSPLRTFNSYGLFAVMTHPRNEIVVEGSNDGVTWQSYEFKWKPGDPARRPAFVAPHQPRLDWQMWFAALGTMEQNAWFQNFLVRLLQGKAPVLSLLARNPFGVSPPRYIRAVLYEYHFTNRAQRRASGAWWRRERVGMYCPRVSLRPAEGPPPAPRSQARAAAPVILMAGLDAIW